MIIFNELNENILEFHQHLGGLSVQFQDREDFFSLSEVTKLIYVFHSTHLAEGSTRCQSSLTSYAIKTQNVHSWWEFSLYWIPVVGVLSWHRPSSHYRKVPSIRAQYLNSATYPPVRMYIIGYFSGEPRDFLPNFRHQRNLLCPADTDIASLLENFHNSQVGMAGIERNPQILKYTFQTKTKKSPCSEDLPAYTLKHLCRWRVQGRCYCPMWSVFLHNKGWR